MKDSFFTDSFKEAYELASAHPGEIINFHGKLPSGYEAKQQIVKVPVGGHVGNFTSAVEGTVVVSSSEAKGVHVIGTTQFGGEPPNPFYN